MAQVVAGAKKSPLRILCLLALLTIGVVALDPTPSSAEMRSTKLSRHLCKTVHGGRFVAIPGFPGEKIDRRLLRDIRWMKRRFHIFITDGYSLDPAHAQSGEHPLGLATDIVPNRAAGGTWSDIAHLAHLAEPKQNYPIPPWRWVGWNGDAGHGRGDHLHLSWMHSPSEPGHPARVVYTRRCPVQDTTTTTVRRHRHRSGGSTSTGGTTPSGGDTFDGGVTPKLGSLAPAIPDD